MKKLIAVAALFAGIAAAAFAQDGEWKVGFGANYSTELFYATSVKGSRTDTLSIPGLGLSGTTEFGNYNKGEVGFFGGGDMGFDDRQIDITITNSGENYSVKFKPRLYDWVGKFLSGGQNTVGGGTGGRWGGDYRFLNFLNDFAFDEWVVRGNLGIFDAQVGSDDRGGFVSAHANWGSWIGNDLVRFGLHRADDKWVMSNNFTTVGSWGKVFAVGVTPIDGYKFSLGYRLDGAESVDGNPFHSQSAINGTFLFSGRPLDGIAFDLFYAIKGKDADTFGRPQVTTSGYYKGSGSWENVFGVFVGVDLIPNLGISVGYTLDVNVYETGTYLGVTDAPDWTKGQPVTFTAPAYSGIDLRLEYTGIDKIGLLFGTNISFTAIQGKRAVDNYNGKLALDLSESKYIDDHDVKLSQGWFYWEGYLKASFGFIDGVDLVFEIGDKLGVKTTEGTQWEGTAFTISESATSNSLNAAVTATYGVGGASLGIGLMFGLDSKASTSKYSSEGYSLSSVGNIDTVKFGIPIRFGVSF